MTTTTSGGGRPAAAVAGVGGPPAGLGGSGRPGASGGAVPGWCLRLALAAVAAGAVGVAMAGAPQIGVLSVAGIVMMLLALGTALAPDSVLPLLLLVGLVIYRVVAPGPTLDAGLAALLVLMPLIHQLAGVAGAIPLRSRCRWRVLRPAAQRLAVAVLPVEIAVLVAAIIL